MKLKTLLVSAVALLCSAASWGYTTSDLVSDGWTLASNLSNNQDYVYVFVDAGAQETAVVRGATQAARPRYNTLSNPIFNKQEVWVIEKYGDNYAILGIEDNYYFSTGNAGWDDSMTDGVDSNKGLFSFNLSGEKYDIRSVAVTGDNNYMGHWNGAGQGVNISNNDDWSQGDGMEDIAVNKAYSNAPGYRLYKMSKGIYLQKYLQQNPNLAAPVNVSYFILNSKIYQAYASDKMPDGWSEYNVNSNYRTDENISAGNNSKLKIWNRSNGRGDYYQIIAGLPNGLYSLTTFVRDKNNTGKVKPYIMPTGGSEESRKESADAASGDESDRTTDYLAMAASPNNSVNVGMHTTSDVGGSTVTGDNFRLQVNPYLSTMATALSFPGSASLTAGLWYYYDIPAANTYDFTSSAAATVYYTQAVDPLLDANTTSEAFTTGQAKTISLSSGRVYFKASEATTFSVEYRYAVGSATLSNADGSYTQSTTFSVTYPEAATNDPSASVALVASSKATVNGNEVALSAVTNGFSLDLAPLTANTDYHIVIPAGVYGYDGESMNAAIDVTIHTPAVFDGFYFLRSSAGKYMSRGGDYNSRAIMDEFGLPLTVATSSTGITQFTYVDNGGKLFLNGSGDAYTDNNTAPDWTIQTTEGGFYLAHANEGSYKNKKLNIDANDKLLVDDSGLVLVFEPVSEHNTYMEALKDAQAATAATAAGISVADKSELATILDANYNSVNVDVPAVSFTEKWDTNASAEWGAGKDMYSNTVSELPAGLYKLTVNAFYRINGSATAAEGARANVYLYGGTAKTQLYSIHDFPATEGTYSSYQRDAYGDYPDDKTSGEVATTSRYLTELYVYHTGGDFTYGIHQPSRFSNREWFGYQNFTLTRYEQTEVTMKTFAAGTYGTFIAPFDVEIPTGITASKVTGLDGNRLILDDISTTIPQNTPVVVYSDERIEETFYGKDGSNGETSYSVGLLTGVYTNAIVTAGNYVLQTQGGVQGFYEVVGDGLTAVPYRAYLNSEASSKAFKAFFFGDDAVGINRIQDSGIKNLDSEVYNLAGQRLSKARKGVNIINGKKVLIK